MQNQITGSYGENLAEDFLKGKGYKILQKNFKARYGEIDLIALDKDTLVFIEVKTRKSAQYGSPEEAITPRKLYQIAKTSQIFKSLHPELPEGMRIDAVCIELDQNREVQRIELLQNITG